MINHVESINTQKEKDAVLSSMTEGVLVIDNNKENRVYQNDDDISSFEDIEDNINKDENIIGFDIEEEIDDNNINNEDKEYVKINKIIQNSNIF